MRDAVITGLVVAILISAYALDHAVEALESLEQRVEALEESLHSPAACQLTF